MRDNSAHTRMRETGSIRAPHAEAEVTCVAVSGSTTTLIATGGSDFAVKLWSAGDLQASQDGPSPPLRSLVGHTRTITGIAFSPDEEHIASCCRDAQDTLIWDLNSGACVMKIGTCSVYAFFYLCVHVFVCMLVRRRSLCA